MDDGSSTGEERELDRLYRFLTRSGPRFGLALALYRDPVVAREVRRLLEQRLEGQASLHTLVLGAEDGHRDIVARMIEASEGVDVLFVVDLDRLLVDETGAVVSMPSVANLNERRDHLPSLIDARVVFWVSRQGYEGLVTKAYDLHEVMLTVAEFDRQARTVAIPKRALELPSWFSFVSDAEAIAVERRAQTLVELAGSGKDDRSRADAAASAAQAFVAAARLDEARRWMEQAAGLYERTGDFRSASIQRSRLGELFTHIGDLDAALVQTELAVRLADRTGDERHRAIARGQVADILQARGELDRALQIRQDEQLPVYKRLGDVFSKAVTMGKIADILQARGELDRALQIRQDEQLPVYERLGDVRSKAITMGKIADILQARGELDRALQIRQDEELPVYERLGDVRLKAITMGKIADILQTRGELDRALQIRQDEELPVYERLGDVRSKAVTMGQIADILQARGELDRALQIRQDEELPVYERLGDVRSKATTMVDIALLLFARHGESFRPELARLLTEAHRDLSRMRLPEATTVEAIARAHDIPLGD